MSERVKRLVATVVTFTATAIVAGAIVGCSIINPKPDPPTPTPTPTPPPVATGRPTQPVNLDLLVRTSGGKFTRNGQPHALIGAIPCWPTDGTGEKLIVFGNHIPYLWTLFSKEWVEATVPHGANIFHARLGPSATQGLCCGLEKVGGPYAADGSWNQAFWDTLHEGIRAAADKGANAEIDILDGWLIKHAILGDAYRPWTETEIKQAMALPLHDTLKKWVFKGVYETCNYGNVIYQIGNENNLAQFEDWRGAASWTPQYERAMYDLIRDAERQAGCESNVVHVIGSNTRDFDGPYEYMVSHNPYEDLLPVAGKPMSINEYNPHMAPSTVQTRANEARVNGQGFWYWRSDGDDATQDESIKGLSPSADVNACPAPLPPRENLDWALNCHGEICDSTPLVTKNCEYCASIGMGEYNGQIRCGCPARNECGPTGAPDGSPQSFQCDKRLPCEQYLIERSAPLWKTDGTLDTFGVPLELAFRVKCYGCTYLEVCNGPETKCKRVTF